MERYLRVNLLGQGPRLMKKRIYRAAVSQRFKNTAVGYAAPLDSHHSAVSLHCVPVCNTIRSAGFYTLCCRNSAGQHFHFEVAPVLVGPLSYPRAPINCCPHFISFSIFHSCLLFYFTYSLLSFPPPVIRGTHFFLVSFVPLTSLFLPLYTVHSTVLLGCFYLLYM